MNGDSLTNGEGLSRRHVLKGLGALGAAAVGGSAATGPSAALGKTAVYQYYHTDWTQITADMKQISQQGFDAIQVPPAQRSRLDRSHQKGVSDPPLGYQPVDFTDFNSVFGTEDEYREMVETAHEHDIEVIADAVINHMAADDNFRGAAGITFEDLPQFSKKHFHPKDPMDYQDPKSVEEDWLLGLKDLDHDSEYVREQLRNYIEKYADLGVDGVRWDAAKHIPESFFKNYANPWAEELGLWAVGEVLQGSVRYDQQYADTGMSVTDYALYYTMLEDVFHSDGDMRALDGAGLVNQSPFRALTFVSNHDSEPPDFEKLAYAYILTYEGYPRVYSEQISLYDWKIRNLLSVRKRFASGPTTTRHVDEALYVYERDGNLLVGLNRADERKTVEVDSSWPNTLLIDYSWNVRPSWTNDEGKVELTIPPRGWVCHAPEQ